MNKLMGFLELKESSLPTVPLQIYKGDEMFDSGYLWTVRTAVYKGNDLNLPRKVGVSAAEAEEFACKIRKELGDNGMVFFYPYFIAKKSGTLEVRWEEEIIEAVNADLWNLVTYSDREVTYRFRGDQMDVDGERDFLTAAEIQEIREAGSKVRRMFRDDLLEGKSILLEWSYAVNTNAEREELGGEYLVFYEVRSV